MPKQEKRVIGGGGTAIATVAVGPETAQPIVFIHGWSQSAHAWDGFLHGALAQDYRLIAIDMRGHGRSDRPDPVVSYRESTLWADDVAAVIAAYHLARPILVGWSYGGYVIADYLRHYGEGNVGGLLFAGAITQRATEKAKHYRNAESGKRFKAAMTPGGDNREAARDFLRLCTYDALPSARIESLIDEMALVPTAVRAALFDRPTTDNDDVLAKLTIPVTIVHGAEDRIVLPASAEDHAAIIPRTTLRIYPNVGHMPFEEDPAAFESDLRALAETVGAGASH